MIRLSANGYIKMRYIDTHAHYWDRRFEEEYGKEGVDQMIDTLFQREGLLAAINVGTSPETSRLALRQAYRHPHMYAAVGIHPSDAQEITDIDKALAEIRTMLGDSRVVALGEIGLDYHYEPTDRALQLDVFHKQMAMAEEFDLPVVIHDREAHGDCMDVIRAYPRVRGVFHSYSGSAEMAEELLRHGYMISFSGTVTFKNAKRVAAVAESLPPDRVFVETDCPYLTPHPYRGKLNHSGYIPYTVAALADLYGITPDACSRQTAENAVRFFGLTEIQLD